MCAGCVTWFYTLLLPAPPPLLLPPPPGGINPTWPPPHSRPRVADLRIVHCNDLFGMGSPLGVVASLRNLKTLMVEDCHCRLFREPVAELGRLTSVGVMRDGLGAMRASLHVP